MKLKNKIWISVYNEDNFEGICVPLYLKSIIEKIIEENEEVFDGIYEDYTEYRDYEVESSSQARHGSLGTTTLNNLNEFNEWFNDNFNIEV